MHITIWERMGVLIYSNIDSMKYRKEVLYKSPQMCYSLKE